MKSSLICLLIAGGLFVSNADVAQARSFSSKISSPSPTKVSSPSPSSPFRAAPTSTPSARVNSVTNHGSQQTTVVKSNSTDITNPVKATYTPKSVITTTKPSNTTIVEKKHYAPNPDNKPTEVRYVTRYGSDNRSYSVPLVVPIGVTYDVSLINDDYFPVSARRTVIYNNTGSTDVSGGIVSAVGYVIFVIILGCIIIIIMRSRN